MNRLPHYGTARINTLHLPTLASAQSSNSNGSGAFIYAKTPNNVGVFKFTPALEFCLYTSNTFRSEC